MLLGVISATLMTGAGYLVLRLLRIHGGAVGLGLSPSAGIGLLAGLSAWGLDIGAAQVLAGGVLLGVCLTGLALGVRDLAVGRGLRCALRQPGAAAMLVAALAIPIAVLSPAEFVKAGVPDYTVDGSTHAELVDALRRGVHLAGLEWYPTGFHAPIAALLALTPQIDSASGVVGWAVGLSLLAPLAIFGLTTSIWRDARVGAASALVLVLTSAYPYGTQLYSVWPMAAGLLLGLGLWTTTLLYLANPSLRLAVFGGLLAGAIMLTHGTEVYTVAIGLAVFVAANWRQVACWRAAKHVGLSLAVAVLVFAPYLPSLGGWAAAGGAVTVGTGYFDFRQAVDHSDVIDEAIFWTSAVSSGYLVDLPVRLALLVLGGWLAFRRRQRTGRSLVPLIIVFTVCVGLSRYVDVGVVRAVFGLTLPWAVDDRLIMTLSVLAAPLGGLGLVWLADALAAWLRSGQATPNRVFSRRRAARLVHVLGLIAGLGSVILVAVKFSLQTGGIVSYTQDDALAMAWLRQNAHQGDQMLNDGTADAGIWAPYKGNIQIVLSRSRRVTAFGPELLLRANLGQLDTNAEIREAACALGVRYVFHGATIRPWADRQLPELDELRRLHSLEEVFSSGQAAVFRTRLECGTRLGWGT